MASAEGEGKAKPALKKPVFVNVKDLQPGTAGHNVVVKVVSSKTVVMQRHRMRPNPAAASASAPAADDAAAANNINANANTNSNSLGRPRNVRIAECVVGDDTGVIVFTARNEQVDIMKEETTLIIRNGKIDMFKGTMRLAVDKWGRVEVTEPANFNVNVDNNLSAVEYELVNIVE